MNMRNPHSSRPWVDKAESDLRAVKDLWRIQSDCLDVLCFHCQQCAEKYLKAVLAANAIKVPMTHSLTQLVGLLSQDFPELAKIEDDGTWLSAFAIDARYPSRSGMATTREHAERAIKIAEQIKDICLHHLKGEVQ